MPSLIDRTIAAIDERQAALPAMPVADTLKRKAPTGLSRKPSRATAFMRRRRRKDFPFWPILAAHEKAFHAGKSDFTDDAAIAEWAKIPVRIVAGSPDNVKLTWARDILDGRSAAWRPRAAFPDVRTGNGYDVHSFEPGDHVTLCGVAIPHAKKLSGHSDADVGLHALTDALLATCGAGDIGTHFPPSDPQWKGAASRLFVEHAAAIVRSKGGRIANADITLICEAPRIGPHREAMIDAIAVDARHLGRPHFDQGDDQREARLYRPRGRHRRNRDGQRGFSRRGSGMSDMGDLADRFLKACASRKILVATAESCTGGMIISLLTDIPGSSSMVDRGFVTYSNEAKMEMLGVSAGDARQAMARCRRETALEMAAGALARSRAGITLAVTGIAGPDGGSAEKPVGLVWFGTGLDRQAGGHGKAPVRKPRPRLHPPRNGQTCA